MHIKQHEIDVVLTKIGLMPILIMYYLFCDCRLDLRNHSNQHADQLRLLAFFTDV